MCRNVSPGSAAGPTAATSDFHILQYQCFHTASVAFRKAFSPIAMSNPSRLLLADELRAGIGDRSNGFSLTLVTRQLPFFTGIELLYGASQSLRFRA